MSARRHRRVIAVDRVAGNALIENATHPAHAAVTHRAHRSRAAGNLQRRGDHETPPEPHVTNPTPIHRALARDQVPGPARHRGYGCSCQRATATRRMCGPFRATTPQLLDGRLHIIQIIN